MAAASFGLEQVRDPEREAVDDRELVTRQAAQCPGEIERLLDGAPAPRAPAAVRLDALAHLVVARLRGRDQRDGRSGLGCEAQRVARLAAARTAGDEGDGQ